uniref:Uncharacterized protein n=1 Tax=Romanomermis culicivorax TaxID=13658 RepID=A0A915JK72_ROMCU
MPWGDGGLGGNVTLTSVFCQLDWAMIARLRVVVCGGQSSGWLWHSSCHNLTMTGSWRLTMGSGVWLQSEGGSYGSQAEESMHKQSKESVENKMYCPSRSSNYSDVAVVWPIVRNVH